ncbi:hypothetical protein IMSAGC011_01823 [Lachnospiraceae bacterium]|nr:hypothetical protein IMSAGC011_01823 [Lachnospiraceae bacterium]
MNHIENRLFEEIKQLIDRSALIWLTFMTGVSLLTILLCLLGALPRTALWSLLWFLPTVAILWVAVHHYHKKAKIIAQKQQISMMAYHAKQVMQQLQHQIPDALITDSKIKMRYLARHGIDVDAALARLGQNIEKYNELAVSFLQNSDKYEDTLYDLLQPDTLMQYGSNAHALRVKANELGLVNLTDTVFFHEIEAYAGCIDVVRDNWKKLSLELDEAYSILSEYVKSIGLVDGNHISFKKWGEQLQEAFQALETYDTQKAKTILNELIKSPIDSDITSALRGIVSNIDEMMVL